MEREIVCTDTHEFLTRGKDKKVQWKQAKELRENDRILTKIENKKDTKYYYYKDRKFTADSEFCELMGIFASRGSIRKDKVEFLFYPGESAIKNRVTSLIMTKFGIIKKSTENRGSQLFITYSDKDLENLFSDITGVVCGRTDKKVPECVLGAKNNHQLGFVKGWLEGEKDFSCYDGFCALRGSSSSYNFIRDIKMILLRSGIMPIVKIKETECGLRTTLVLDRKIGNLFYNSIIKNCEIDIPKELKKETIVFDGNLFIEGSKLVLSKEDRGEEIVYCLEVSDSGSFSVGGQTSHNCRAFSKTFISILGMYLICMFRPGSKVFICAPKKERMIAPSYSNIG